MNEQSVNRITKVLGLSRKIIGLKFLESRQQYEEVPLPFLPKKVNFCFMVKNAMDGNLFKANQEQFNCQYGAYALGLATPGQQVLSGQSYHYCGLYETTDIAKEVVSKFDYIQKHHYGVVLGPLEQMDAADIVIIAGTAEQIMRITQGYAYRLGTPCNIKTVGNQGMCSDLAAKPFTSDDLNLSFLCKGARLYGQFESGYAAAGFPLRLLDHISDGLIMTLNGVAGNVEKKELLGRLNSPHELGIEIKMDESYGKRLSQYDERYKNSALL